MGSTVLEEVRRIGPAIAARSDEIEQSRRLPLDIVDQLRPTQVFRMYVAPDLDGPDLTAWESLQVLEELAFHDGAAGWCAMIGSTTSLVSSLLPEPFARQIFGDPGSVAGGFAMPAGRAQAVDGGLRVSGQWAWGSGTHHCNWIGGGCLLVDDSGVPAPRADGLTAPFVFFPTEDVELIDNWHVTGLSGSGSGDYVVRDVFVPEGRWAEIGRSEPWSEHSYERFSFFGLLAAGVGAVSLGIGRRSLEELVALAQAKKPSGSGRLLAERSQIQADVAEAESALLSARSWLREVTTDCWETAESGHQPSDEQKRVLRLAATHATQTAAAVAESMYKAGGGAAVYKTSPLQRTFRDAYVATQHAMVAPRTREFLGRLRLGLPTDTATL
jgi:alkylation response protein AidB-like acyl-CoA dehydrogenase